jgi:hypothetical protein
MPRPKPTAGEHLLFFKVEKTKQINLIGFIRTEGREKYPHLNHLNALSRPNPDHNL